MPAISSPAQALGGPSTKRHKRRHYRGRSGIRKLKQDELKEIFNDAYLDREQAEVVSLTESRLLDIDCGEVLRNSRYIRAFNLE